MSDKNQTAMDQQLWKIFENINRWLEYSERKNGLMLTFIGAQLVFVKLLTGQTDAVSHWLVACASLLGLAFLLILISLYPKTSIPKWLYFLSEDSEKPTDADNLLFYGDIAKHSQAEYIKRLERDFHLTISGNKYCEDLCAQILVNSQVTKGKFKIFKQTAWLMFFGQILFLVFILRPLCQK